MLLIQIGALHRGFRNHLFVGGLIVVVGGYRPDDRQHPSHNQYFPSTPSRRVYWFFHSVLGCSKDVAAVLRKIACCDDYLPTGSPLSPIMAYYSHVDVWEKVAQIPRAHGCVITIHIDDVTISGAKVPTAVVWEIKQVIHAEVCATTRRRGRLIGAPR